MMTVKSLRNGMWASLAALVMLVEMAHPSYAARFTGAYLLELCEKNDADQEIVLGGHAICQSYIAGIIDTHNMMKSFSADLPSAEFCVPQDASLNEIHGIVLNYLRNNGQHDHFIAVPAVVTALFQTYPCR